MMKRSFVIVVMVALCSLATESLVQGAPTKVIDQQNTGPVTGTNGGSNFGQSFIPTLPGIDYIEILMGESGTFRTVRILDGMVNFDGLKPNIY